MGLHFEGASRRVCRNWRLELSNSDRIMEVRPLPGSWKHHGLQTIRSHSTPRTVLGPDLQRSRCARRNFQRRLRCGRRRWLSHQTPRHRKGQLHGTGSHRKEGGRICGRRDEVCNDGTRRQESCHHPPRCGYRPSSRRSVAGQFLQLRPGLHQRDASVRARETQVRVREESSREDGIRQGGRSGRPDHQLRPSGEQDPPRESAGLHPAGH